MIKMKANHIHNNKVEHLN